MHFGCWRVVNQGNASVEALEQNLDATKHQPQGEAKMVDQIGTTAGKIWRYLDENGKATINKVIRELDEPERVILMGIGWLAREDNLVFSTRGRYNYIVLKMP